MKKKIMQLIDFMNPTILLAPIIPMIYSFGIIDEKPGYYYYFLSILIFIPIVVINIFSNKCKLFITYIITSLLFVGVMTAIIYYLSVGISNNSEMLGVVFLFTLEEIIVFIHNFRIRLMFAQQLEDEGRITKSSAHNTIFTRPSLYSFILLGAYYFIVMGFSNKKVCNVIFFSSIVYLLIFVVYEFLAKTEEYLEIHHDVSGIPKKRVYGIGAGMTGIMAIIIIIAIIPSMLLINNRPYYDLAGVLNSVETQDYEPETPQINNGNVSGGNDLAELLGDQEIKEWPEWAKFISKVFMGAILAFAFFMMIKGIFQVLKLFELSFDENGDIVENIEDNYEEGVEFTDLKYEPANQQTKKIRRQYKKAIRKARKELPNPYESPSEIEEIAGIKEEEWMKRLHDEYEKVRYGKQ